MAQCQSSPPKSWGVKGQWRCILEAPHGDREHQYRQEKGGKNDE